MTRRMVESYDYYDSCSCCSLGNPTRCDAMVAALDLASMRLLFYARQSKQSAVTLTVHTVSRVSTLVVCSRDVQAVARIGLAHGLAPGCRPSAASRCLSPVGDTQERGVLRERGPPQASRGPTSLGMFGKCLGRSQSFRATPRDRYTSVTTVTAVSRVVSQKSNFRPTVRGL